MDLKTRSYMFGLDLRPKIGPSDEVREHRIEPTGSIVGEEFLD
jgi:hypothetical protein